MNKPSVIEYEQNGDYLIPKLTSPAADRPIGRWGRMHKKYLQEHRPALFNHLLLSGKLNDYLATLDEQANTKLELIITQMKVAEGVTEEWKARDQMAWVQHMNSIRNRAEEMIIDELMI